MRKLIEKIISHINRVFYSRQRECNMSLVIKIMNGIDTQNHDKKMYNKPVLNE